MLINVKEIEFLKSIKCKKNKNKINELVKYFKKVRGKGYNTWNLVYLDEDYENKLRTILKDVNFDELPCGLFLELKYETKVNKTLNNVKNDNLEVEENQIVNSEEFSIKEIAKQINITEQTLLNWKKSKPGLIKLIYLGLRIENHKKIKKKHLQVS